MPKFKIEEYQDGTFRARIKWPWWGYVTRYRDAHTMINVKRTDWFMAGEREEAESWIRGYLDLKDEERRKRSVQKVYAVDIVTREVN